MHTPLTTHPFSVTNSTVAESAESLSTPAVIVAGTRVSRELVRVVVATAFLTLEAALRLGDLLPRRFAGTKRVT